ncbi:MAG: hypothetical protein NWF05_00855 [Candidatus Bathyarchaeota archaeon]|nr:hypothetical protein [Candidatus Bathyarchaeota archaeon]
MSQTSFSIFDNYQCSSSIQGDDPGGRGVAQWSLASTIIPPGQFATLTFTPKKPKCFTEKNECCVYFYAEANPPSSSTPNTMHFVLNGDNTLSNCVVPGSVGYGNWQAFDIAFNPYFNEDGINTLRFLNQGDVGITVSNLRIIYTYSMYNLSLEADCEYCSDEEYTGADGNLGPGTNCPCNFETHGGLGISYVQGGPYDLHTLDVNQSFAWTFNFNSFSTDNYQAGSICLFNFNKVWADANDRLNRYTTLEARVNGSVFAEYYLISNASFPLYPSFNIIENGAYDDNGVNTVTLTNRGPVPIRMVDGPLDGSQGQHTGINVYRIYQTDPVYCTGTITASVAQGNGRIVPSGTVTLTCGNDQEFIIHADDWWQIDDVQVDSQSVGTVDAYTLCVSKDQSTNHTITAYFSEICYECYISCQPCQGCVIPCQVCEGCQACNISCQYPCEVSCTVCESACQVGCEVSCTTCETVCQVGCEVSCTTCETACQDTCELSCQVGCEVSCTTCETVCQAPCEVECQVCNSPCYAYCQTTCQLTCQTACELACQTACELACQTACELACQTGCEVECQTCMSACEDCQWCEYFCQLMCMYCEAQ